MKSSVKMLMKRGKMILIVVFTGVAFLFASGSVLAFTECWTKVTSIYSGDNGMIWMIFANGQTANISVTSVDAKNILALATTSLVADRHVMLRVSANAVPCDNTSGVRSDVQGLWLLK